jgi:SAM-dependent methyltransferase
VISCDISEVAIAQLKSAVPEARGLVVDMRGGLPFDDESFPVVIADLCLHYFAWDDTVRIVREIGRVLDTGGYLLCRLNSTNDIHYGAGCGECIEDNFFLADGKTKRFFDIGQVENLFSTWERHAACECRMDRYKYPKYLWEVAVQKNRAE